MNKKTVIQSLKAIAFTGTLMFGIFTMDNLASASTEIKSTDPTSENVITTSEEVESNATVNEEVTTLSAEALPAAFNEQAVKTNVETDTTVGAAQQKSIIPKNPPVMTGKPDEKVGNVNKENSGSLISIGIGGGLVESIVGKVDLNIIGGSKVETDEGKKTTGGLVQGDITNSPILGDTHLGVAEGTKIETDDYNYTHGGLVVADIDDSIVGDAHVGVIEKEKVETDEYEWSHGGLVIVETENTPILGNIDTGILENEKFKVKNSDGNNEQPGDTEEPGDNEQPGDTEQPGDNEEPGDTEQPGDNDNPCDNEQPVHNNNGNNQGKTPVTTKPVNNTNDLKNSVQDKAKQYPAVEVLPTTGSMMDSTLLVITSLIMIGLGMALRKLKVERI